LETQTALEATILPALGLFDFFRGFAHKATFHFGIGVKQ
jgi:hypothetical protein